MKAGVPESKVTFEAYFNHKSKTDFAAIERIASVLQGTSEELNGQPSDKKQKVNSEVDFNTITFVTGNKKKLEEKIFHFMKARHKEKNYSNFFKN